MFAGSENRMRNSVLEVLNCVCESLYLASFNDWKCQLAFCTSVLNNALHFVSKRLLQGFYGRFLLEEDVSLLEEEQVVALLQKMWKQLAFKL